MNSDQQARALVLLGELDSIAEQLKGHSMLLPTANPVVDFGVLKGVCDQAARQMVNRLYELRLLLKS
jgi:hypothetical protein